MVDSAVAVSQVTDGDVGRCEVEEAIVSEVNASLRVPSVLMPRVARPVLHELLDHATRRKVCMVVGAAGWGKSTAVGSWTRGCTTAWVHYSSHRGDPLEFAQCVRNALQTRTAMLRAEVATLEAVVDRGAGYATTLCACLRKSLRDDLVVVVDDLHELPPDSDPVRLLEELCQHGPDRLHMVLLSRRGCPFSLTRLRGRGQVAEIQAADLALDVVEIATLLRSTLGEEPGGLAAQVRECTAGWPAAVCMAVDTLCAVDPDQRIAALDRLVDAGELLHTYLAEEVIGGEPEPARELLGRLGVFGEASAALAVGSGSSGARLLADLTGRGLLHRIPGHLDRWSLIRPLREFYAREPTLDADQRVGLHRQAARECTARGDHAEALGHLLAAGAHGDCAALLIEHGSAIVNGGHLDVVLEAGELAAQHLTDPRIQRVIGHARQVRGQWDSALTCFRRASNDEEELHPALAWQVGLIAYARGEFNEILLLRDRARLAVGDATDRARLFALAATACRMVGDDIRCRAEVEQAVAAAHQSEDPSAHASAFMVLAVLAAARGDCVRAELHCINALQAAQAGGDLLQVLRLRVIRAVNLVELGVVREGLAEAQTALQLGASCGDPFLTALALVARGRASIRLGAHEEAFADFAEARDRLQHLESRFLAWALCGLGDLYRIRGQLARARGAYEEAIALAEPGHEILGLSWALSGLARIRAGDNIAAARELAERVVALDDGLCRVEALLTRGWVALTAGHRDTAAADAARAGELARARRDNPGIAEAIALGVLCTSDPAQHPGPLAEAIQIWEDAGCRVDAAAYRVVADRVGVPVPGLSVERAEQTLRECGVDIESRRVAGPLAVVAAFAPALSIRALGVFQVLLGGEPIPPGAWQSRKARDLLKILVARRRPVPRDQLMELLWPETDPAKSGNRLSVQLSTLRNVLQCPSDTETGPLLTAGGAVGLDPANVEVDVEEFLAAAGAALDAHRQEDRNAVARLVAAEAKHTGGFLDGEPYQEWAAPLAEDVRTTYIAVLRALGARLREAGDVDESVRYTLKLLQQDSFDERAHLDLLRIHLEAGHHGEAQRRYRIYVQRMKDLGVEPHPFPHRGTAPRRVG